MNHQIIDKNNGVLCWFYVYNSSKYENNKISNICGIVVIKQLNDGTIDNKKKIFFYTKTNYKYSGGDEGFLQFDYGMCIEDFIHTKLNDESLKVFITNYKAKTERHREDSIVVEDPTKINKFIIGDYSELTEFLNTLIDNDFEIPDDIYESMNKTFMDSLPNP
jgi:hypothetical protein